MAGAWLFADTRVPVRALFENLVDGAGIDEFIEWFPGMSLEQVVGVLRFAKDSLSDRGTRQPMTSVQPTSI